MGNLYDFELEQLIRPEGYQCECGHTHKADMKYLKAGPGVIGYIAEGVKAIGGKNPFVVCGPNSYEAAGKRVCEILKENDIPFSLLVVPCEEGRIIEPSEYATGSIALNLSLHKECDMMIAVGSGVINDTCRLVSNLAKIPYMIVGTAPSMDGYASSNSCMEISNIKLTLFEHMPAGIICDTEIMAGAPMRMLHAGLGDMFAKYTALCEWRIAEIVNGEERCPQIAELMRRSLRKIVAGAGEITSRSVDTVTSITDGLILSGLCIAFIGSSRPASGQEHYFSHCWEMMSLVRGEKADLHGIQVGIGTLLTLKIYDYIKTLKPTMEHAKAVAGAFDRRAWADNIKRVFGSTADGIITAAEATGRNDESKRLARAELIVNNWDKILSIMEEELPAYEDIHALMEKAGMPMDPSELGYSVTDTVDAFVCSRDVRDKYLLSSVLFDIGYLNEAAEWLRKELASGTFTL
ncbi:MAG: sn-glycerol-1-phosphate dehydrogenase [Eubacteriales bacterium]|nr:sn-glycerol-1-phosphate dehydrogenase [Eubacteriales bacterium]